MVLDEKTAQAVVSLRGNPDFATFMSGLSDYTEKLNVNLMHARTDIHVAQGRLQAAVAILEAVNGAADKLDKLRQPKN